MKTVTQLSVNPLSAHKLGPNFHQLKMANNGIYQR